MIDMVEMEVHVEHDENILLYVTLKYADKIRTGS